MLNIRIVSKFVVMVRDLNLIVMMVTRKMEMAVTQIVRLRKDGIAKEDLV